MHRERGEGIGKPRIRLLHIETTLRSSWVAWREIEVIAAQ
jgi:hypothetical protein